MLSTPLFPSPHDILRSTRRAFQKFLKKLRRRKHRSARGCARRHRVASDTTGRNIRAVPYKRGRHALAPVPTLINAASAGHYDVDTGRLAIRSVDYRGWERSECESLTLILLVDVSSSTLPYRDILARNLKRLREYFIRHNDRIALIALQGSQGRILNHPTRNHRIVIRNLAGMTIQGQTPLADGLLKALDVARLERMRKPASRSVVVLLSDCFPEPISGTCADFMQESAYQRSLRAASLYRKNRISLLVVDPMPRSKGAGSTPGKRLCHLIVEKSGGKLVELSTTVGAYGGKNYLRSEVQDADRILYSIEAAFGASDRVGGRGSGPEGHSAA